MKPQRTVLLGSQTRFLNAVFRILTWNRRWFQSSWPEGESSDRFQTMDLKARNEAHVELRGFVLNWRRFLSHKQWQLPCLSNFQEKDLETAVVLRLRALYTPQYQLARRLHGEKANHQWRFVLVAPKQVRSCFLSQGIPIASVTSKVLWALRCVELAAIAAAKNARGTMRLFGDFRQMRRQDLSAHLKPSIFWFGLSPSEFGVSASGANIVDYLEERHLPVKSDAVFFLVNSSASSLVFHDAARAFVGSDPFRTYFRKPIPLRVLLRQLKENIKGLWMIAASLLSGRWWNLLLLTEADELPRFAHWMEELGAGNTIFNSFSAAPERLWFLMRHSFGWSAAEVFYSGNYIPLELKDVSMETPTTEDLIIPPDMDQYLVWNEEQRRQLQRLGISLEKTVACGPIVFGKFANQQPSSGMKAPLPVVRIGVFDVIPSKTSFLVKAGYFQWYYVTSTALGFYDGIIKACEAVYGSGKFQLIVKPKRKRHASHDPKFWDQIERWEQAGSLHVLPGDTSALEVMKSLHLSISMPHTGVAEIGRHFGIPSCYFDSTERLASRFLTEDHPPLVSGTSELERWLRCSPSLAKGTP